MRSELIHKIFTLRQQPDEGLLLDIYRYQYAQNRVYAAYCDALHRPPAAVQETAAIPFLPISFFKTHAVVCGSVPADTWFESSGTSGAVNSRHYLADPGLYQRSFLAGFQQFYGNPGDWCILGLLPAYLERQHSSLVVMVDELIRRSGHRDSGFYLYNQDELANKLQRLEAAGQKTLLFGVTFALLDFADRFPLPLRHTVIMETGGMKGRGKELTRAELHDIFNAAFDHPAIHSEYGMTELLSQAYSLSGGIFYAPPWLNISLREDDDPLTIKPLGQITTQGIINVTDLANIDSCCFIATEDLGRLHPDGGFEVLGRVDNADIRGCSQLVV